MNTRLSINKAILRVISAAFLTSSSFRFAVPPVYAEGQSHENPRIQAWISLMSTLPLGLGDYDRIKRVIASGLDYKHTVALVNHISDVQSPKLAKKIEQDISDPKLLNDPKNPVYNIMHNAVAAANLQDRLFSAANAANDGNNQALAFIDAKTQNDPELAEQLKNLDQTAKDALKAALIKAHQTPSANEGVSVFRDLHSIEFLVAYKTPGASITAAELSKLQVTFPNSEFSAVDNPPPKRGAER